MLINYLGNDVLMMYTYIKSTQCTLYICQFYFNKAKTKKDQLGNIKNHGLSRWKGALKNI